MVRADGESWNVRDCHMVYRPDSDGHGNWVPTVMGGRHDAFCSFADTEALHPLHLETAQASGERDTCPWTT